MPKHVVMVDIVLEYSNAIIQLQRMVGSTAQGEVQKHRTVVICRHARQRHQGVVTAVMTKIRFVRYNL